MARCNTGDVRRRAVCEPYTVNEEASIEEVLTDPIAALLRRRDGLSLEQVRRCIAAARARIGPPPTAAP